MGKRRKHKKPNRMMGDTAVPTILQNSPATSRGVMAPRPHCHNGPVEVFKIGNATVWAGSRNEIVLSHKPWALLLCCAGHDLAPYAAVLSSTSVPEGIVGEATYPWISLDWPDGDVPSRINPSFWDRLADALADGRIEGDVGIYCVGGHGRTGTALSILSSMCGAVPEGADPVAWVRSVYCDEAVETDDQCAYVERITCRPVFSEGSLMNVFRNFFMDRERKTLLDEVREVFKKPLTNEAGDVVGYDDDDDDEFARY